MTQPVYPLYDQHAHLWPLIAPLESYRDEMREWVDVVRDVLGERAALEVLDLGTGGGHHLFHFADLWSGDVSGVATDLSTAMLERVGGLIESFECLQADMTELALGRKFSLVSVHDSFCYLRQADQVARLFATISAHLETDGMALVKVDALAGEFEGPYRYLTTFEEPDREITLTHYEWDPDPSDSELEVFYHFLERRGQTLSSREERHVMGLFSRLDLESLSGRAGLSSRWVELERWDEDRPNPLLVLRPLSLANP